MENLMAVLARDLPEITGRNIHLSVDLGFLVRHKVFAPSRLDSFADELLAAVINLAGPSKSVVVSTFNFDFGRTQRFDVLLSDAQVGRFSQLAMKNQSGIRTPAPFYSFKVFGPHARELEPYPFQKTTGENSPFDFLIQHDYLLLAIGHHINKALTLVHHSENVAGVPWRYEKLFEGLVRGSDRVWHSARTTFFVRQTGVLFSGLTISGDEHFRSTKKIRSRRISLGQMGMPLELGELVKIHEDLVSSLSQNETRLSAPLLEAKPNPDVITARIADRIFSKGLID